MTYMECLGFMDVDGKMAPISVDDALGQTSGELH